MSKKKKYTLSDMYLVKGYKPTGQYFKWTMSLSKIKYLKRVGFKIYSYYKIQ